MRPEFALPPSEDDDEDEDEDEDDEDDEEEDKKKKKKKSKDPDPDPVTGIWLAHLELAGEDAGPVRTRLQVRLDGDHVAGFLRSAALSSNLIEVHGSWDAEEGELKRVSSPSRARATPAISRSRANSPTSRSMPRRSVLKAR
jgi:hypothetical protein